jgi:hypothetical protein
VLHERATFSLQKNFRLMIPFSKNFRVKG